MSGFLKIASLVLLGTAPLAAVPAPATADSVVRPGDPRLRYMGHWGHVRGAAITVNSGSELTFRFTGHTLTGLFDASTITVPSQIYVSIDGGPRTLYKVDRDEIDFTPAALPGRRHTVTIAVKDVDEYENRWILPLQSGIVLTGFRLGPRARVLPTPRPRGPRVEFYGDSITEGVAALCDHTGVDCADGTVDYANLTGRAFHADFDQVGFGKQGIIQPGHGNVGTAAQSFGWNFAGSPADDRFRPGAVVVNEGTNDVPYPSADFEPGYLAYLREIRTAYPRAWIFAMRPFGGYHADDIATAVRSTDDPRVVYVDTTGWLSAADGDYNGGHPNVQGHRKAADRLIPLIAATTGWRTR
ncbi:GDSL-type esterase/lipase family protein [Actinoallomurus sp. CA-150999]|uniref:GDSL-type esterase/lipase family protein n=1 Tax=Actinoallomurus sp. CA-150999 TaxID=3239887 RepID=UPI003D8ADF3A